MILRCVDLKAVGFVNCLAMEHRSLSKTCEGMGSFTKGRIQERVKDHACIMSHIIQSGSLTKKIVSLLDKTLKFWQTNKKLKRREFAKENKSFRHFSRAVEHKIEASRSWHSFFILPTWKVVIFVYIEIIGY